MKGMDTKIQLIGVFFLLHSVITVKVPVSTKPAPPRDTRSVQQLTAGDTWSFNSFFSSLRNYFTYDTEPSNQLTSGHVSTHASFDFPTPNVQFLHRPAVSAVYITPAQWSSQNPWSPRNNQSCGNELFRKCQRSSYRTIDGSCNNLDNPTWGMAQTRYARLLPTIYSDGIWTPALAKSGRPLPRSRLLSHRLFPEVRIKDPQWTLATMQWGQIITHDMAELGTLSMFNAESSPCCTNNNRLALKNLDNPACFPIVVGPEDPDYRNQQCLTFQRAVTDRLLGCSQGEGSTEQITMVTQFLDLSLVYGSSDQTAMNLRALVGGRLRTEIRSQREWPPTNPNASMACDIRSSNDVCYVAGDDRVNQNTQLTVLQIILLREHNRIAGQLSRLNPHWNDETIYQETRRITIAINQHISYSEWLPIILGAKNTARYRLVYNTDDYVDDYDASVNPSVLNEHSNAAFRVFHSLIAGYLKLVMEDRSASQSLLRLSDWFMRPSIIEQADNMDALTRGLADQPEQNRDEFYDREITVFLFRGNGRLGGDLRATDIQRNRDHGLASYNDYRDFCGLRRAGTWGDFGDTISAQNIEKLSQLYETPDDVDLTVGGSLEENAPGALTGPTFLCILIEQFYRTRVGDRFWYESSNPDVAFTREQLREIRKASIGRLLCDNSDNVQNMQRRAFEIPSPTQKVYLSRMMSPDQLTLSDQRFHTLDPFAKGPCSFIPFCFFSRSIY
ncbi:peroxidase-like isoform X2 [Diachasmimorpha longicaudata]|uniref:peroxidase-like isoform X2 n=1 Tax=Diachasmimorpha longicaudata TaxID=58733 RepID=UPI0030B8DE22